MLFHCTTKTLTPQQDMIELETRNANSSGLASTLSIEAPTTSMPPDSTVDCIISNRAINIVPEDKPTVFHEMSVY